MLAFVMAVFSAGIYVVWILVQKKVGYKTSFPFGPFLCLGMATAYFLRM